MSERFSLEPEKDKEPRDPFWKRLSDTVYWARPYICATVAVLAFCTILWHQPYGPGKHPFGQNAANRAFALLVFSIVMWIGNPVPPFVTGLLVPIIAVWLGEILIDGSSIKTDPAEKLHAAVSLAANGVFKSPARFLPTKETAEHILSFMVNRIVLLVFGSFCLARALDKTLSGDASRCFARCMLKYCRNQLGAERGAMLLTLLLVLMPMYLSAFLPHEAATMVVFNLTSPLIQALPSGSTLGRLLLMSLLLGGNIGGMLSMISTPQNILFFSMNNHLRWWQWMEVSVPLSHVAALLAWTGMAGIWRVWEIRLDGSLVDLLRVPTSTDAIESMEVGTPLMSAKTKEETAPLAGRPSLHWAQKTWIAAVAIVTVVLWLSSQSLEHRLGGVGIVSLFPVVALFGSGVLDLADLHHLPWDIILLAMGATTLSEICKHSGAFELIGATFREHLGTMHGWLRVVLLCTIMAFSGAVKSRFVAALVYLPLAFLAIDAGSYQPLSIRTGQKILAAFACSAGMMLPVSGLVNVFLSQVVEKETGQRCLRNRDIIAVGAIGTLASLLSIVTVGYLVIQLI
jgi:phosphate transporter